MKIYFAIYNFTDRATSGADQYHYNLAQIMLSWGWQVRSLTTHNKTVRQIGEVSVYPIAADGINYHVENQQWADVVITFPMPHKNCKIGKPLIIIKHNDGVEPFDFSKDRVLYCGEAIRQWRQIPCLKSFVFNPVNRYAGTDKRGDRTGPWIIVNCNLNKGGESLIRLAKICSDMKFAGVLGSYGTQYQEPLPNLEYWPANPNMSKYYQRAAGLLSLSAREGFPTCVMEAMAHGLPVVGLKDCKGFMDAIGLAGIGVSTLHSIGDIINHMTDEAYENAQWFSLRRSAEIEANRDFEGLKAFLQLQ